MREDADSFAHFSDEDEVNYEGDGASHTIANYAQNDSADGRMHLGYDNNAETSTQHSSVNGHDDDDDDDMRQRIGGHDDEMDAVVMAVSSHTFNQVSLDDVNDF